MERLPLTSEVFHKICELIQLDTVNSVSCEFTSPFLWRVLVEEQVCRAKQQGLPPQVAFTLSGPDCGLPEEIDAEAWGGEIHIPWEGICGGDLFVLPQWRIFKPEAAQEGGSLRRANFGKQCHDMLSDRDFGELATASRLVIGEWILYASKLPYQHNDPIGCREAYRHHKFTHWGNFTLPE
jgi:hypothetical protein